MKFETLWLLVGFAGQTLFFLRFLIQWIVSEKQKKSVIPLGFWYLSITGALLLLSYAVWRKDPVFILGQSCGILVYSRNLILIKRQKQSSCWEESL